MDAEVANDEMRTAWGRVASGWGTQSDVIDRGQTTATEWLLDRSDPQPGQIVLDLAGGAGGLGRLAADRVGTHGLVLATDFAPEMVDVARRLGEANGLTNLEYTTLDAQRMDLDDESVDVVLCRSGLMLVVDPGAALGETRRVLRPGGRLAFSVFTTPEQNPWASTAMTPFIQRGHVAPPEPGGPGMFALGDADRLRTLVTDAGFDSVELERLTWEHDFANDDAVWAQVRGINALLSPIVESMSVREQAEMRRAVIDAHSSWRAEDGSYRLPGSALAVLAS